jgi:hypothetical protein
MSGTEWKLERQRHKAKIYKYIISYDQQKKKITLVNYSSFFPSKLYWEYIYHDNLTT